MIVLEMARLAKGWSQERLAQESGLSVQTVVRIEGGKLRGSNMSLMRLGEALDVPLDSRMKLGDVFVEAAGAQEFLS
jgi:UDP-N-acetylglucosamine 1-carboxyvinyltransferase